ncbi:MAG: hypothetical protein FJ254_09330 [Phycisphaerae bacterium]|nr:hypothetical protein [Phycisphaerae bacterium]
MTKITHCGLRRAMTIADVAVGVASATLLVAVLGAAAASMRSGSGTAVSLSNLMQLGTAHALYAGDNNGLQWCNHRSEFGLTNGNCSQYLQLECPPQVILGQDLSGGLWGYWLGGGICPPNYPGNCGNWAVYQPMDFGGTTGYFGSWRLLSVRSFHQYLNGRLYDPVYFAPNDRNLYRQVRGYFDYPGEFTFVTGLPQWSSYAMAASAMWDPGVFRPASEGGFRNPSSYANAWQRQSLFGAAYPELKSLTFEHNWCQGGGGPATSFGTTTNRLYNASAASTPATLFYDGHVWLLPNANAIADDASLIQRGLDGLWSRDTPLGSFGYYGQLSIDGSNTSHSVLTTKGILGRDLLSVK